MVVLARKLLENIIWRGIFLLTLFLINLILARILQAGGSGHFNLLVNNLSFFILFSGLSLEASLTWFAVNGQIERPKLVTLSLGWPLAAGLFGFFLFPGIYSFQSIPGLWFPELLGGLFVTGSIATSYFSALFYAERQFRVPNQVLAGTNGLYILFILFTCYQPGTRLEPYILPGFFLLTILQAVTLVFSYFAGRTIRFPVFIGASDLKKLARYGGLVMINNIVFFLVYRIDYWFMDYFRNSSELGNYIQVSKLVQLFMVLPTLLATVIFPFAAGDKDHSLRGKLPLLGRMMTSLYLICLALLAATGKFLFPYLYGQTFTGMYFPFLLLMPGILGLSLHALLTAYFAGQNRVKLNLYGALIALAAIICLDLFLIPGMGGRGAAIASSAGYCAYAGYMFNRFRNSGGEGSTAFLFPRKGDLDLIRIEIKRRFFSTNKEQS